MSATSRGMSAREPPPPTVRSAPRSLVRRRPWFVARVSRRESSQPVAAAALTARPGGLCGRRAGGSNERDGAAPRAAGVLHLHREAGDLEARRPRDAVQIDELLD